MTEQSTEHLADDAAGRDRRATARRGRVPFALALFAGVLLGAAAPTSGAQDAADDGPMRGVTTDPAPLPVRAQSLLARGDSLHEARDARGALAAYEQALGLAPRSKALLQRAARDAIDVGEVAGGSRQDSLFTLGASYAARALAEDSSDADSWFQQSRALGRVALSVGPRDRTRYAVAIHDAATRALALAPQHAGAAHVLGRWHAEVMRLNGIARMIAKSFLGGKVFGEANWRDAVRLLEQACALEPDRTVHLLALGEIYRDTGERAKARATLEAAIRAPLVDPNEELYKQQARAALNALR